MDATPNPALDTAAILANARGQSPLGFDDGRLLANHRGQHTMVMKPWPYAML